MTDLISSSFQAMSTGAASGPILVFGVGLLSSAGPCIAPRFIAITGLVLGGSRAQTVRLTTGFVVGLVATYATFGLLSSLLVRVNGLSQQFYWLLAGLMLAGGLLALRESRAEPCGRKHHAAHTASVGGALILGASSALIVSPCCTPLLLVIVTYTSAVANPRYGALLLGCFALGHAVPVFLLSIGANRFSEIAKRFHIEGAASVVAGGLMLFLAGYYAVLA